jgi:hypothetical protein
MEGELGTVLVGSWVVAAMIGRRYYSAKQP